MTDQQLREQFDDWARPLRGTVPPPVTVIRRRARQRTARRPPRLPPRWP